MIWIWIGIAVYLVLGALYSIEAAARMDALGQADSKEPYGWDTWEYVLVLGGALLWPLSILAMCWYAGFEWRTEQIRKRAGWTS